MEIPVWNIQTDNYPKNAFALDACSTDITKNPIPCDTFALLKDNFDKAYAGNRAPTPMYFHSPWLAEPSTMKAVQKFIKYAASKPNTYFITMRQLMDWMKDPVGVDDIGAWLGCGVPGGQGRERRLWFDCDSRRRHERDRDCGGTGYGSRRSHRCDCPRGGTSCYGDRPCSGTSRCSGHPRGGTSCYSGRCSGRYSGRPRGGTSRSGGPPRGGGACRGQRGATICGCRHPSANNIRTALCLVIFHNHFDHHPSSCPPSRSSKSGVNGTPRQPRLWAAIPVLDPTANPRDGFLHIFAH